MRGRFRDRIRFYRTMQSVDKPEDPQAWRDFVREAKAEKFGWTAFKFQGDGIPPRADPAYAEPGHDRYTRGLTLKDLRRIGKAMESGMAAAKKLLPEGYLTPGVPNGFFIGVEKPMGIYTWDNMIFTNAKVPDDVVYKFIDTMEKNKAELVTIQPALRDFSAAALYKKYDLPYHPGALKYFKDHNIQAKAIN